MSFWHRSHLCLFGVFGSVDPGPAKVAVQAMKANTFPLWGHTRRSWDFDRGLGLAVTLLLTAESVTSHRDA